MPASTTLPAATAALAPRTVSFRTTAMIIASALFMEQLDGTVLATALPAMARSFHVGPLQMSVALTSYLLSLAVFIPASGRVADRYGSRTVFRTAVALFTLGSILCGQAGSVAMLVGARMLQGVGGAMMVPVGRLVLLRTVPKSELVSAMTWLLVPAMIGPVIGPPVGGFIVTWLSWRWIFYLNVPIGIVGMVLATLYFEELREPEPGRFDLGGLVLSGISLSCLMFGLEMGSRGALPLSGTLLMLGIGLASGMLYIRHARRHPEPILDLSLLSRKTFSLSLIGGSFTRITAGALPFLLPMQMQLGFGMSAASSGMITFMTAAGALLMKAVATPALRRFGFRTALIWNGVLATSCLMVCAAFRPGWPLWSIYAVLLVGGFFQSLQFTAYNTVAYAEIPRERMSAATSFYATFQQLMLSAGICVAAATLFASIRLAHHSRPLLSDFSVAYLVVGAITLLAAPVCARLPADAGDEISGHVTPAH